MVCRPPLTFRVYGPPAAGGWISTCQRRSAPAVVEAVLFPISTRIASPGSDQPQILSVLFRCSTMLSPNNGLTNGSIVDSGPKNGACAPQVLLEADRRLRAARTNRMRLENM